jgi:hypothetical protein
VPPRAIDLPLIYRTERTSTDTAPTDAAGGEL